MYKCEKCGADTNAMVQMSVCAPSSMIHNFSKKNMSKKEFRVLGVLWETADLLCTNEKCGYVTDGYGNYVSKLAKENKELKEKLEALTKA